MNFLKYLGWNKPGNQDGQENLHDDVDVTEDQNAISDTESDSDSASAKHPPVGYYLAFVEGTEKSLLSAIKAEINEHVDFCEWDRRFVQYRIFEIDEGHPYIKPGYMYEVIYRGDGYSYIEQVIELFKGKNTRIAAVKLKSGISLIHFDSSSDKPIVTEWWENPNRSDDQLSHLENVKYLSFEDNEQHTTNFYNNSYAFFYISKVLFLAGMLSIFPAAMFKYVFVDQSKTMIDENYYTESRHMPISQIRELLSPQSATENQRILAVRGSSVKGWYVVIERKNDDGSTTRLEQKISKRGMLSEAVQVDKPESMLSLGIPPEKKKEPAVDPKKPAKSPKERNDAPKDKGKE